jgi:serine protease Do
MNACQRWRFENPSARPNTQNLKNHQQHGAHLKRQREFSRSHLEDLVGAVLHEVFIASDHQWDRKKDKQKPHASLRKLVHSRIKPITGTVFTYNSIKLSNLRPTKSPGGNIPSARENQPAPQTRLIQGDQNPRRLALRKGWMRHKRKDGHMTRISSSMKSRTAALALGLVLGVAGLGVARTIQNSTTAQKVGAASANNPPATLKLADPKEGPSSTSYAPIVKEVLPSVVNISSSKVVKANDDGMEQLQMDPMFRQFFGQGGMQAPKDRREKALGSGVIVSPEGYILTNNHVVDGATDVKITLSDKREFKARVVGADPKTDVAVLKIDASNVTPLTIGDSSKVEVGDVAIAVGDPFGVGQTVTKGIISAKGRGGLGIEDYEDFLQTDAPINPGNSGGALVNDRGELIGINTAIISHGSGGSQGIGFAVPANLARQVMDQILKNGKVVRAYLGILPQDVTPSMAKAFGEKEAKGVVVSDVTPSSPAQENGIQRGDIILELNGKPVTDSNQLRNSISMMPPGTGVKLKTLRNGSERDVTVKLGEMPTETAKLNSQEEGGSKALDGVEVSNLNPETAKELGLPSSTTGVVVNGVDPSSKMAESGLRRGDVIQEVNHQSVKNVSEFQSALKKGGDEPLLLVNRGGRTLYVAA